MSAGFQPTTPLERAVVSGDYQATIACLRPLSAAERTALRGKVVRLHRLIVDALQEWPDRPAPEWGGKATQEQHHAIGAALVLCGTTADVADGSFWVHADMISLCREFNPPCLEALADELLGRSPRIIANVQALIASGLVPRPDNDAYVHGLMILLGQFAYRAPSIEQALVADPDLQHVLLRVMEVEGTTDCSLAGIDKYKGSCAKNLLALCEKGVYARETLLDKTLSALERDWPQFRSGWFSRFHAELAPTIQMMAPHTQRYLALCHSRIAPTVAFAVGVLKELDDAGLLQSRPLLEAMRPVMAANAKAQVEAALRLIDRVVVRDPSLRGEASALIVIGLAHEVPSVQKQVLRRLAEWGIGEAERGRLQELLPSVAAVHRPALERLLGASAVTQTHHSAAPVPIPARVGALDASRRLKPLESIDALVECIAHAFENDTDIDGFERAVAGLVRAAPISSEVRERLGPVIKRAARVRRPLPQSLARLLLFVATGQRAEGQPTLDHSGNPGLVQLRLIERIDGLMEVAAHGHGLTPLSSPTHRRGFIDPAEFVERVAAHDAQGLVSTPDEQVRSLLRLAPQASDTVRSRARQLRDTPFTHALRYALGDDVEPDGEVGLMVAAAQLRHPGGGDAAVAQRFGDLGPDSPLVTKYVWQVESDSNPENPYHHLRAMLLQGLRLTDPALVAATRHLRGDKFYRNTFGGIDEASVLYAATLLPSCLDPYFADGARDIGSNLDWWEARWHNRAYLQLLLDPTVPATTMATLLLALALAGKEPGQTALAVDAFVQWRADGRLDATVLGAAARDLLRTTMVKAARYAKSLRAALRIDPQAAAAIAEIMSALLEANPAEPPKDTALLLELLQEVTVSGHLPLPSRARAALEVMQLAGKGRALQRSLLSQA